jgi:epidermal growth factor receptor substrate 15
MRGLWQRLKMHADEQVTAIKQEYEQSMQHIRLEIEKYKTNNQRWQKMYDTWIKEKEELMHTKLSLEKNMISLQADHAALVLKLEAQCQQTIEKQKHIEELHRLHKLAQENLEHYRESSRVQRLMDQEKYTQELQKISLNLKNTEQQLLLMSQAKTTLESHLNKMTAENTSLKTSNENINHQLSKLQSDFIAVEKRHMEVKQQAVHWQEQHAVLHKKLDFQDEMLIEYKKQNAVLAQQLSTANEEIKKWQEQNQLLSHEKWEIAQEKAQLEGINKQMQKMLSYKEVS